MSHTHTHTVHMFKLHFTTYVHMSMLLTVCRSKVRAEWGFQYVGVCV